MKHRFRKLIIALKRRPHNIPMAMLVLCCMIFTFNLTEHSNAAMYVSSRIIALYVFIITLCSMLVIFSFGNAFSKNSKRNKGLMMAVVYLLLGAQLLLDTVYLNIMIYETMVRDNPVPITPDIAASMNWIVIHLSALVITLLAIVLMPLYHKLILRIDTSIEDDELNEIMNAESIVDDAEEYSK